MQMELRAICQRHKRQDLLWAKYSEHSFPNLAPILDGNLYLSMTRIATDFIWAKRMRDNSRAACNYTRCKFLISQLPFTIKCFYYFKYQMIDIRAQQVLINPIIFF